VAGGDLNDAWRLELDDGTPAFAKTGHPGTYEPEAAGLAWLADGGASVPEVLAEEGVTDLSKYQADPSGELALDLFLDGWPE